MVKKSTQSFLSIIKIFLRSKFFTKSFFSELNGEQELVILGNGPSLRKTIDLHLSFISSKKKLCVNGFVDSIDYPELKPDFYVLVDPAFWKKNLRPDLENLITGIIKKIIHLTNWDMVLYIPYEAKNNILFSPEVFKNDFIKIRYFNKTSISGFSWFENFCFKKQLGIPRPQNVLVPSLMLSINMGFKKIFLAGADHTWHENLAIDEKNNLCIKDPHFYDSGKEGVNYRPILTTEGKSLRLHEQFNALSITFGNYFVIEKYAQFRNSQIINISEVSFIDAFERLKLN